MRIGAIRLIGVGLLAMFLFCYSIFNETSPKNRNPEASVHSDAEQAMEFHVFLSAEDGFYEQVEHVLKAKGYEYQLLGMVHAEDYVDLHFVLTYREATAEEQKEVIDSFRIIALENDLNPDIFRLKVSNHAH